MKERNTTHAVKHTLYILILMAAMGQMGTGSANPQDEL